MWTAKERKSSGRISGRRHLQHLRKSSGKIFETASNRKSSRENWRGKGERSLSLCLSHQRRPIATVFQLSVTVLQSC
jgi:hypothetical protein